MGTVRRLPSMGATSNPDVMGEWPESVGKFILNFAGLELLSYHYLDALEPTDSKYRLNLRKKLNARIDRIVALLSKSGIQPDLRVELENAWREVQRHLKWRNRIAHNPAITIWLKGQKDGNPPDGIGIVDARDIKLGHPIERITFEGLNDLVNRSARLAGRLQAGLAAFR
jgi:hypothetical protein